MRVVQDYSGEFQVTGQYLAAASGAETAVEFEPVIALSCLARIIARLSISRSSNPALPISFMVKLAMNDVESNASRGFRHANLSPRNGNGRVFRRNQTSK